MSYLENFGFIENPFPLVPGAHVTVWAGMEEVKQKLIDIIESILTTDAGLSEFVIVHGNYGAGKTHSLKYLTSYINEINKDFFKSFAIYVPKAKISQKVTFLAIYYNIIQEVGRLRIKSLADAVKVLIDRAAGSISDSVGREQERELTRLDPLHFEKAAIAATDEGVRSMVQLLVDLSKGNTQVLDYLLDGKGTIPGSDYAQPISTDYMAVRVLSDLFRCMTLSIRDQDPVYHGVHLFIDEVEEVMESKANEQIELWQSIRELTNRLPYNFCLLMAFSAPAALLEAIMPNAIIERLSRSNIDMPSLTTFEAKDFIIKQLAAFRTKDFINLTLTIHLLKRQSTMF